MDFDTGAGIDVARRPAAAGGAHGLLLTLDGLEQRGHGLAQLGLALQVLGQDQHHGLEQQRVGEGRGRER